MKCLLHNCQHGDARHHLSELDDRVRVRLDVDCNNKSLTSQLSFDILSQGVATFHYVCWQSLVHPTKRKRGTGELNRLLKEADKTAERWNGRDQMESQVNNVVELLKQSSVSKKPHVVVFTGAGISTSAGIGDFRGIFGQWTEDDLKHDSDPSIENDGDRPTDDVPYEDLRPTLAHEAVAWMVKHSIVHHIITQNCDGLHRLSGVPPDNVSELHGNIFIEYCKNGCGNVFERSHDVENYAANEYFEALQEEGNAKRSKRAIRGVEQCKHCKLTHQTTRSCPQCHLPLFDTIINFGDNLRDCQIEPAIEHAEKADVMIVLGSTLLVTPAADLCKPQAQALVICNRQTTPLDNEAAVRVYGDCDDFMAMLLSKLIGDEAAFESWKHHRSTRLDEYNRMKKLAS